MIKQIVISFLMTACLLISNQVLAQAPVQISGKAIDIAGAEDGSLYAISTTNKLMKFDATTKKFKNVLNTKSDLLKVGVVDNIPYVIDTEQRIFSYKSGTFKKLPARGQYIAGDNGIVYIIDTWGGLVKWTVADNHVQPIGSHKALSQVAVAGTRVFIADINRQTYEVVDDKNLKLYSGLSTDMEGNTNGKLCKVGAEFRINRYNFTKNKWQKIDMEPSYKKIALVGDTPYAIDNSNNIFRMRDI